MTTSMKKTATVFSSQKETQAYLESSSSDSHQLQRQSYSELIGMAQSYTPGLIDILMWDQTSVTSLISYIPADMEDFVVNQFQDSRNDTASYFHFYIQKEGKSLVCSFLRRHYPHQVHEGMISAR
mgnify:FL=1